MPVIYKYCTDLWVWRWGIGRGRKHSLTCSLWECFCGEEEKCSQAGALCLLLLLSFSSVGLGVWFISSLLLAPRKVSNESLTEHAPTIQVMNEKDTCVHVHEVCSVPVHYVVDSKTHPSNIKLFEISMHYSLWCPVITVIYLIFNGSVSVTLGTYNQ